MIFITSGFGIDPCLEHYKSLRKVTPIKKGLTFCVSPCGSGSETEI